MATNFKKLQLLFLGDKQDMPFPAKSYVCVGGPFGLGKDGQPLLTPECVTPKELEVWIDDLKKQLDEIKLEARRKYTAYEKHRGQSSK